jgi:hypothetical protein
LALLAVPGLALTPTSRFGIKYSAGDTVVVEGTLRVVGDSLFYGGRKVGTITWQDSAKVTVDSLIANTGIRSSGVIRPTTNKNINLGLTGTRWDTTFTKVVVADSAHIGGPLYVGDSADSASTAHLSVQLGTAFSRINAGDETFTITSSEALKRNFTPIDTAAAVEALLALPAPRQWQWELSSLIRLEDLARLRADSSKTGIDRRVEAYWSEQEEDGQAVELAPAEQEALRDSLTAVAIDEVEQALEAYWAPRHVQANRWQTGWTAEQLYPLSQAVRPTEATPTEITLSDRVTALVLTVQAQQRQIEALMKRVEALEKPTIKEE